MARVISRAGLGLALACIAGSAQAGLEVCNESGQLQSVAIGFKGDTDWTSEGWWNIEPGSCATLVPGDLTKRYYYYFTETAGRPFDSQNFEFCTTAEIFTIVGDTDCETRGFVTENFREIDTGETATAFTLTLAKPEAPASDAPVADGKGPGGGRVTQGGTGTPPPAGTALPALSSDLAPGRNGTPITVEALFQGCELEDGKAYCSFHAQGRKLRVFYGGPTPDTLLYALEDWVVNTPVLLEADRVGVEALQTDVVVRRVTPKPGSDADATLRAALQGDWLSEQDQRIGFTIRGSELYTRYDGDYRGARFVALAATCDAAQGRGPVLVQTKLKDGSTACFIVERAENGVLELTDPSRGAKLRYLADR